MAPHGESRADNLSGGAIWNHRTYGGQIVEDFAYNTVTGFLALNK